MLFWLTTFPPCPPLYSPLWSHQPFLFTRDMQPAASRLFPSRFSPYFTRGSSSPSDRNASATRDWPTLNQQRAQHAPPWLSPSLGLYRSIRYALHAGNTCIRNTGQDTAKLENRSTVGRQSNRVSCVGTKESTETKAHAELEISVKAIYHKETFKFKNRCILYAFPGINIYIYICI